MNATIKPSFWSDARLSALTKDHKHALLWLITNANRDLCGFTEVSPRHFTLETELPMEILDEACARSGGNFRKLPNNVYFVRRFLRHQFGCGGRISPGNKVIKAAVRRVNSMPQEMADAFFEAYPELSADRFMEPVAAHPTDGEMAAPDGDAPSIPHASPILKYGCPNSRVIAEQEKEKEQEYQQEHARADATAPSPRPADGACATMVPVIPADDAAFRLDAASIAELYPRRQSVQEAVRHIARHMADGVDPRAIADGTRAIATVIRQLPSGHLNAYVPSAEKFFANRRWEDDPRTWLRLAPADGHRTARNGGQPDKLSLGGRRGRTIRI
ncbi:MAG: hypothetical protein EOP87_17920 [Verrucomicrobiaceae bacterium]|nr:MAG: hypothetical protein EOP87_17920 [Verrucomicrobiaceae bacterium]